jgi:hypothetical protein
VPEAKESFKQWAPEMLRAIHDEGYRPPPILVLVVTLVCVLPAVLGLSVISGPSRGHWPSGEEAREISGGLLIQGFLRQKIRSRAAWVERALVRARELHIQ